MDNFYYVMSILDSYSKSIFNMIMKIIFIAVFLSPKTFITYAQLYDTKNLYLTVLKNYVNAQSILFASYKYFEIESIRDWQIFLKSLPIYALKLSWRNIKTTNFRIVEKIVKFIATNATEAANRPTNSTCH